MRYRNTVSQIDEQIRYLVDLILHVAPFSYSIFKTIIDIHQNRIRSCMLINHIHCLLHVIEDILIPTRRHGITEYKKKFNAIRVRCNTLLGILSRKGQNIYGSTIIRIDEGLPVRGNILQLVSKWRGGTEGRRIGKGRRSYGRSPSYGKCMQFGLLGHSYAVRIFRKG
eukprot:GHVO01022224.1.p1 GENE.GHVO01022224.1~~GHVO01022224.1.p1  ORF type:complete len:168 (-),score=13.88 GHVO01022224.1:82-585(-)